MKSCTAPSKNLMVSADQSSLLIQPYWGAPPKSCHKVSMTWPFDMKARWEQTTPHNMNQTYVNPKLYYSSGCVKWDNFAMCCLIPFSVAILFWLPPTDQAYRTEWHVFIKDLRISNRHHTLGYELSRKTYMETKDRHIDNQRQLFSKRKMSQNLVGSIFDPVRGRSWSLQDSITAFCLVK